MACLDQATNVQILKEAREAGLNVITFNSFCSDDFPFVGQRNSFQDGYDLGEYLAKHMNNTGEVGILAESLTATDHVERIKGLFGSNASNPIGAAGAVSNAELLGQVAIVGMDDLPEAVTFVCDGTITALKAQRQWDIGYRAVRSMVVMNENHTIPMDHDTWSRFITKADCAA